MKFKIVYVEFNLLRNVMHIVCVCVRFLFVFFVSWIRYGRFCALCSGKQQTNYGERRRWGKRRMKTTFEVCVFVFFLSCCSRFVLIFTFFSFCFFISTHVIPLHGLYNVGEKNNKTRHNMCNHDSYGAACLSSCSLSLWRWFALSLIIPINPVATREMCVFFFS